LQNFALTFNWDAVGPEHFWSLGVEEHFYLFWPFAVYFLSNENLKKLIIGVIAGAFLLRVWMVNEGYSTFYFTFTRFDSLAAGALLALLEQKNYFTKKNAGRFALLLGLLFLPAVFMWVRFTGEGNNYIQIFKFLLFSFIYFSFVGIVVSLDENHFLNKLLRTKFLNYTGKISYGLYVYHLFVYQFCNSFLQVKNVFADFAIKFAVTYLLSTMSFYLFESSFLKLKKYFEYGRKKESHGGLARG
jgi:peptidoglycan/LPS O-acetylase OafA/YrhL